jgi:hypothetical protein
MNKILRSIFKIWNSPPVLNAFPLTKQNSPSMNSPLSVQEGFKISILIIVLSPPFEHNKIPIWKSLVLKLGGGAVLLLWANTFSPFGMNRQKQIFEWNISPLKLLSPLWQTKYEWRLYQRWRVARNDGKGWVMEWKPLSSPKTPIPFQDTYDLVWISLENTLVIAHERDMIKGIMMSYVCKTSKEIPRIKNI